MDLEIAGHFRLPLSQLRGWSDLDLSYVREWWRRRVMTCSGCGTRREEWLRSQGGHPHAYRAEVSQCPGCAVLDRKRDELAEDKDWANDKGLKIVLRSSSSAGR